MDALAGSGVASVDGSCLNESPSFRYRSVQGGQCNSETDDKHPGGPHHAGPRQNFNSEKQAKGDWNINVWDWDSVLFLARRNGTCLPLGEAEQMCDAENAQRVHCPSLNSEPCPGILELGTNEFGSLGNGSSAELKRKHSVPEDGHSRDNTKPQLQYDSSEENESAGSLTLKLGGMSYSYADGSAFKNNKRYRSGSPGSTYPACQVDDCRTDLTNAKDYHKRHKVCEVHFKAAKAPVGCLMQRFCQQCSRFHPVEEFDAEKRSCRRRLAGHNKRRRKTQPEDGVSEQLLLGKGDQSLTNLDIVSLISILSQSQGTGSIGRVVNRSSLDCDYLVQCLKTVNNMPSAVGPSSLDLNSARSGPEATHWMDTNRHCLQTNGYQAPQLSAALLSILSALTGCSSDALAFLIHSALRTNQLPVVHESKELPINQQLQSTNQNQNLLFTSGMVSDKCHSVVPSEAEEHLTSASDVPHNSLQLSGQHLSSSCSSRQYFTPNNISPMEKISPSLCTSSEPSLLPPVVHKLFPLCADSENTGNKMISLSSDDNLEQKSNPKNGKHSTFTFLEPANGTNVRSTLHRSSKVGKPHQQASDNSLSGSDQRPTGCDLDLQGRTGRIIFKLFGKDPGDFPTALRKQIVEWLSQSPSDMESYIRPGCVILTIYVSMPSCAWERLDIDLRERLKQLVASCGSDFWRTGRILVQAKHRFACLRDGKIRLTRSWRPSNAPELHSVWPVAVVAGKDTTLILRGRNLNVPGTTVLCAYRGKYTFQEVLQRVGENNFSANMQHEQIECKVKFSGGPANVLGRCFIEVEHGLKGNIFPVIVADGPICMELRSLELEIKDSSFSFGTADEHCFDEYLLNKTQSPVKKEILFFLNELGWLFQRINWQTNTCSNSVPPKFLPSRFNGLLIFAVERDWCALLKRLLDIFFLMNVGQEGLIHEAAEILSGTNLLHRAVKRNCRPMVDLLLHYLPPSSPICTFRATSAFSPDLAGPGGLTPLHIAASMQNAEGMVDALTSDPHEVGLHAWSSTLDKNHQTPAAYAMMKNNESYICLIERKLLNKRNAHTVIRVWDVQPCLDEPMAQGTCGTVVAGIEVTMVPSCKLQRSCAHCSGCTSRKVARMASIHGGLYRPFLNSILAIATVCVCVCLLFKGPPQIGSILPFKWENVGFGPL